MLNALSFDVEEYFHVHAFADVIPRQQWASMSPRVVPSTKAILNLLRKHEVRATFFVLGCIAEQHPELIREIADDGHELASHGYAHEAVDTLTRQQFHDDVARSLDALGRACPAVPIIGYRAPSFSINKSTPWAYEVLDDLEIVYDSSISPVSFHDRYGVPDAPRFAYQASDRLLEIPVSTLRMLGCNLPVAGGGYFRLTPLALTSRAIHRINREEQPVVVYLHPWEFDPEQPRIKAASLRSRFRHYVNLRHTAGRLELLIHQFRFAPLKDVFHHDIARLTAGAAGEVLPVSP